MSTGSYATPDPHGINVVIIVGVGRSGTSLLQSMLAAHPRIAFLPETGFLRRYLSSSESPRSVHVDFDRSHLLSRLQNDHRLERLGDRLTSMLAYIRSGGVVTIADVYRHMLSIWLNGSDATYVGDKDPRLVEILPVVKRVVPEARVIHLIRDPRDVLASKKRAAWSHRRPAIWHIFANYVQMKHGRRDGTRFFGRRYLEVSYEELIGSPKAQLRRISDFLDLEYDPAMLEFATAARELVSKEEISWKRETLGPLLNRNTGKWRQELDPWEISLTELLCSDAMEIAHAQKASAYPALSASSRLYVQLMQLLLRCAATGYDHWRRWTLNHMRRRV